MRKKLHIPGVASGISLPPDIDLPSIDQEVVDFIDGRNDGAALMLALYGDIADEALPPRLAALLARWRAC